MYFLVTEGIVFPVSLLCVDVLCMQGEEKYLSSLTIILEFLAIFWYQI